MNPQQGTGVSMKWLQHIQPQHLCFKSATDVQGNLLQSTLTSIHAGDSGVGKSAAMQNMLQQQSRQGAFLPMTMTFSAQTTSVATQEIIEAKLERRHRNRHEAYWMRNDKCLCSCLMGLPKCARCEVLPTVSSC